MNLILILEIDALNAIRNACQHLIGDGAEHIAEFCDGQMLTEYLHLIALLTRNVCHVDHRYIHTDITHVLCLLTVYKTIATAIAKSTVQSVSIADRNSSNHGITVNLTLTAIADRLTSRHMAHLKNGCL